MSNKTLDQVLGSKRYYVKSSGALARDISVYNDDSFKELVFKVDGKMFKKNAALIDADGTVVLKADIVKTVPMKVEYTDVDGNIIANLDADSPLKKKYMTISRKLGDEWVLEGENAKRLYTILQGDNPIVQMDMGPLLLHKQFSVDIAEGVDIHLVMGVAWALNLALLQRTAGAGGAIAAA